MKENFVNQLKSLGVNYGDVILVHSSMKALGTKRTPLEVINDLITAVGDSGTLLMPALSYKYVTAENPHFSVAKTEPCVGLIPKTFFYMDGTIRSVHPTHSVCAYGRLAAEITAKHFADETPVGANSPFMKLLEHSGKMLFIGDVVKSCTFMHGLEEIAAAPYTLQQEKTRYFIENADGTTIARDMYAHDFSGWQQEYQRIKDILRYPEISCGKVGKADCFLLDAAALAEKAMRKFREDLYYFVSREE
ncbi:MAG: AAC(3) family N-acetyltransferase [Defluviitaleaceae bacterium]|nr:AAC(3) family N-acetyltransferase [Defluviitaleaceae bacterium]